MKIDLTDPRDFTIDNVRRLIASKDDSKNRQLRVSIDGKAYLSDDVGNRNLTGVFFRFETWMAGNGYCGSEAASEPKYVERVFNDLAANWPTPKDSYIDW